MFTMSMGFMAVELEGVSKEEQRYLSLKDALGKIIRVRQEKNIVKQFGVDDFAMPCKLPYNDNSIALACIKETERLSSSLPDICQQDPQYVSLMQ